MVNSLSGEVRGWGLSYGVRKSKESAFECQHLTEQAENSFILLATVSSQGFSAQQRGEMGVSDDWSKATGRAPGARELQERTVPCWKRGGSLQPLRGGERRGCLETTIIQSNEKLPVLLMEALEGEVHRVFIFCLPLIEGGLFVTTVAWCLEADPARTR